MGFLSRLAGMVRMRRQTRIGPLRLNWTQRGLSSWGAGFGPFSWNSRRPKRARVDLPGPFHADVPLGEQPPPRRRRRRRGGAS